MKFLLFISFVLLYCDVEQPANTEVRRFFRDGVYTASLVEFTTIDEITLSSVSWIFQLTPNDPYGFWKEINNPYAYVVGWGTPSSIQLYQAGAYILQVMRDDIRLLNSSIRAIYAFIGGVDTNAVNIYKEAGFVQSRPVAIYTETAPRLLLGILQQMTYRY